MLLQPLRVVTATYSISTGMTKISLLFAMGGGWVLRTVQTSDWLVLLIRHAWCLLRAVLEIDIDRPTLNRYFPDLPAIDITF